jgi:hypothetical protein
MGMAVWIVAATIFPWHLGLAGASVFGFAAYLTIAGVLLAVADALLNPSLYHRWSDVAFQGVFWTIGLAVPAGLLFVIAGSAAPAADEFRDNLCVIAGLDNPADHSEAPLEEALEPTEDCEVDG